MAAAAATSTWIWEPVGGRVKPVDLSARFALWTRAVASVAVIVINWNTRELLAGCLASIAATTADLDVETVVVDNGSADGSAAMVRERFPGARLIANRDAQACFVVLPVYDVVYPAGLTAALEAMCMARAVIATRSRGLADSPIDGETCHVSTCRDLPNPAIRCEYHSGCDCHRLRVAERS